MPSRPAAAARRRALAGLTAPALALASGTAQALMAGAVPDTPLVRVDANLRTSPWTAVVSVLVGGSAYSGVAIAPRHVLTAAHVAGGAAPGNVQVQFNLDSTPVLRAVTSVTTYPGASFPYDDLTVLQLAQDVPAGTLLPPLYEGVPALRSVVTLVGYGQSGQGNVGPTVAASASVKRSGRNVIDQYVDHLDSSGRTSPFWLYDFDGPAGNGALGGATLGNATETSVASGDSGSPAFVDSALGPALFGLSTLVLPLTTASTSIFGAGGGGIVVSTAPYLDWLRTQTAGTMLTVSQMAHADVPVAPAWALALLGAGLMLARRRRPA